MKLGNYTIIQTPVFIQQIHYNRLWHQTKQMVNSNEWEIFSIHNIINFNIYCWISLEDKTPPCARGNPGSNPGSSIHTHFITIHHTKWHYQIYIINGDKDKDQYSYLIL